MCSVDANIISLMVSATVSILPFCKREAFVHFAHFFLGFWCVAGSSYSPQARPADRRPKHFRGMAWRFYNVFSFGYLAFAASKTQNAGTTAGPVLRDAASAGGVLGISSSWASGLETYRWVGSRGDWRARNLTTTQLEQ